MSGTTDSTVAVRRYPTKLFVRCGNCGHQGVVKTYIHSSPKLKCSRCGARNAIVGGRDFLRGWANRRRGR